MSVPTTSKLVMIVEDDADIREVTVVVVEELGYRVACAENGLEDHIAPERHGLRNYRHLFCWT